MTKIRKNISLQISKRIVQGQYYAPPVHTTGKNLPLTVATTNTTSHCSKNNPLNKENVERLQCEQAAGIVSSKLQLEEIVAAGTLSLITHRQLIVKNQLDTISEGGKSPVLSYLLGIMIEKDRERLTTQQLQQRHRHRGSLLTAAIKRRIQHRMDQIHSNYIAQQMPSEAEVVELQRLVDRSDTYLKEALGRLEAISNNMESAGGKMMSSVSNATLCRYINTLALFFEFTADSRHDKTMKNSPQYTRRVLVSFRNWICDEYNSRSIYAFSQMGNAYRLSASTQLDMMITLYRVLTMLEIIPKISVTNRDALDKKKISAVQDQPSDPDDDWMDVDEEEQCADTVVSTPMSFEQCFANSSLEWWHHVKRLKLERSSKWPIREPLTMYDVDALWDRLEFSTPRDVQDLALCSLQCATGGRIGSFLQTVQNKMLLSPGMKCGDIDYIGWIDDELVMRLTFVHYKTKKYKTDRRCYRIYERDQPFCPVKLTVIHLMNIGALMNDNETDANGQYHLRPEFAELPLFRVVNQWNQLTEQPLRRPYVSCMWDRLCRRLGLSRSLFSSHSLRRGYACLMAAIKHCLHDLSLPVLCEWLCSSGEWETSKMAGVYLSERFRIWHSGNSYGINQGLTVETRQRMLDRYPFAARPVLAGLYQPLLRDDPIVIAAVEENCRVISIREQVDKVVHELKAAMEAVGMTDLELQQETDTTPIGKLKKTCNLMRRRLGEVKWKATSFHWQSLDARRYLIALDNMNAPPLPECSATRMIDVDEFQAELKSGIKCFPSRVLVFPRHRKFATFIARIQCRRFCAAERSVGAEAPGRVVFVAREFLGRVRHVNLQVVKYVIIASRGFLGEQFFAHLLSCAETRGLRQIADNKSKFLFVPASSGFKHSLREVLADQIVASRLADTKAQFEVQALENFFQLLSTEPSRAFYGSKHVQMANDALAIQCLLLCDSLFRSNDIEQRRKYVQLVDSVKSQGGIVRIFSGLHVSGEQLNQLTGIAAILKFGLPELEDEDLSDSDHEGNS